MTSSDPTRPARRWTDNQRRLASYWSRVIWAERRELYRYRAPQNVRGVLAAWRGDYVPTDAELRRLEEFIERPEVFADPLWRPHPRAAAA